MLDLSKKLLFYKRKEVEKAIVDSCANREVGTRFGDSGFGKRPDMLVYENDVLDSVKRGATSFHISEELWKNPMQLTTEMSKEEQSELRIGWDLVLDIDCPYWEYSKLTTYMFIKALKRHGVNSVSCKFSGNKGFHIGVPYAAFPKEVNGNSTSQWFPEGPKKIALYLVEYIASNLIEVKDDGEIIFDGIHKTTQKALAELTGKTESELSVKLCPDCNVKAEAMLEAKAEFVCPKCTTRVTDSRETKIKLCPKCNSFMEKFEGAKQKCRKCGSMKKPKEVFDPLSIVDVDTILISSRHMFRSPYSMHEKSGLVSIPIPVGKVLTFEKDWAQPEKVFPEKNQVFLDTSKVVPDEAKQLLIAAFDFGKEDIQYNKILSAEVTKTKQFTKIEDIAYAIPLELFPPCILKILEGLDDGKKRSMFVLTNFLTSVGWNHASAEELLLKWNSKNNQPLRDGLIKSQMRYHKQKGKKVLPPNCRSYYQDFGVCTPDALCQRIKNPVQYAKRKAFALNKAPAKRATLSEEQKAMRRVYREKLKKGKERTDLNEA